MTELKVSETNVTSAHGNTKISVGDRVSASGGWSVPTGECVVIEISEDEYSGDTMVLLAQKRDGGEVTRVEAAAIDKYHERRSKWA